MRRHPTSDIIHPLMLCYVLLSIMPCHRNYNFIQGTSFTAQWQTSSLAISHWGPRSG